VHIGVDFLPFSPGIKHVPRNSFSHSVSLSSVVDVDVVRAALWAAAAKSAVSGRKKKPHYLCAVAQTCGACPNRCLNSTLSNIDDLAILASGSGKGQGGYFQYSVNAGQSKPRPLPFIKFLRLQSLFGPLKKKRATTQATRIHHPRGLGNKGRTLIGNEALRSSVMEIRGQGLTCVKTGERNSAIVL
jgi:hypothetical protein